MLTYYVVTYVDVMEAISYLYKLSLNVQVCYNPGLFLLSSYILYLVQSTTNWFNRLLTGQSIKWI